LVGVISATTLTDPIVEGLHEHVAGEVTLALISPQPGIVTPFCKKFTFPAVPTTTVMTVLDWYVVGLVTVIATDCEEVVKVIAVADDETSL
jgi:hypothetical protein